MPPDLFARTRLQEAFGALRADLVHDDGPRISTMRNYRFAILPYDPRDEFALRRELQRLVSDLRAHGWNVLSISLLDLLVRRLESLGPDALERLIAFEKQLSAIDPARALSHVGGKVQKLIEGPQGIAADCIQVIADHVARHPDREDRTVVFIGRAGALYPFFRTSALLRHLDGHTHNVPVVLLYPGERHPDNGLSFMGQLTPDRDYRPRIYP